MLRKLGVLAVLIAALGASFAAVATDAQAQETDPAHDLDGTFLRGRGVLDAQGDGLVAVNGKIDLYASADGGVLLVKDIAGDAAVRIGGEGRSASWHGFTAYFGFDGQARVTGSHVGVIVLGENIDLHAVGVGWAYLKGEGSFEVNRGPFRWSPEGAFASITSGSEQ